MHLRLILIRSVFTCTLFLDHLFVMCLIAFFFCAIQQHILIRVCVCRHGGCRTVINFSFSNFYFNIVYWWWMCFVVPAQKNIPKLHKFLVLAMKSGFDVQYVIVDVWCR